MSQRLQRASGDTELFKSSDGGRLRVHPTLQLELNSSRHAGPPGAVWPLPAGCRAAEASWYAIYC